MKRNLFSLAVLFALPAVSAAAFSVDATSTAAVTIVNVDETDDVAAVQQRLRDLLDQGRRTVIRGDRAVVARMRPDFVGAWPATNTILLDPAAGLGIHGVDTQDMQAAHSIASAWRWSDDAFVSAETRQRRDILPRGHARHFSFSIAAASPAITCRNIVHELGTALFGEWLPSDGEQRALRREARRWCQYGTLPAHVVEPAQFTIASAWSRNYGALSLVSEWALIRNEDAAHSSRTRYLFWVKTVGEGDAIGFSREAGRDGGIGADDRLHDMVDAAIHAGWGPLHPRGVAHAWPLESAFPYAGNVKAFRCEAPEAARPAGCPIMPVLRKLYPEDSSDGSIPVSPGEGMDIAGEALLEKAVGRDDTLSLGMAMIRHGLRTQTVSMPFVRTLSNADTQFFRTTRWTPDYPALYRWATTGSYAGSLASVTPLASTLNPRYEAIWELPWEGNAGRDLPFHLVYELGWNACANRSACLEREGNGQIRRQAKTRLGWSDHLVLHIPVQ